MSVRHCIAVCTLLLATTVHGQVDTLVVVPDSTNAPLITAMPMSEDSATMTTTVTRDTLDWRQRHSPQRAALYSAVLPGAGQVYNRKYWKVPIVLAGLGVSAYFIRENTKEYRRYKDAYIAIVDGDPATTDEFNGQFSADAVLDVTDTYRRWRDLSYIALGAVYVLNVVDASVDAYFVRFDVGSDLTVGLGPSLDVAAQGGAGLTLAVRLR
ncbi:MAG: DUF5683 domain-containing protein [Flavobacteriales bacterium]